MRRQIYAFWYLPTYVTHTKILARERDHVRRFYGNCRTLWMFLKQFQFLVKSFGKNKFSTADVFFKKTWQQCELDKNYQVTGNCTFCKLSKITNSLPRFQERLRNNLCMWFVARFRIIYTISKTWKTPMEECYF